MRNVAFVAAVILVVVLFVGAIYVARQPATSTAVASSAPTATATLAPAPIATPNRTYVDSTYKFSVVLPEPYRHSDRLSIASTGGQRPAAQDAFTARTESNEANPALQVGETASPIWNYVAVVHVFTGTGSQGPRDFYNAFGGSRDQVIQDITVDGHQAVKVTNAASYPTEYVIKDGDQMFVLGYSIYPSFDVPAGATREKLEAILASFKFVP